MMLDLKPSLNVSLKQDFSLEKSCLEVCLGHLIFQEARTETLILVLLIGLTAKIKFENRS